MRTECGVVRTAAALTLALVPAAATAVGEPSVRALQVAEEIQVDGLLDEPGWSMAEPARGFRQREPREGEPASEPTEVAVLYDSGIGQGLPSGRRVPQ